uniref:Uncharacterized protein n=1 Tax=Aegilops tauschii subsp. strangulata TaxID=200361 RepID=A0A453ND73_AEGTS
MAHELGSCSVISPGDCFDSFTSKFGSRPAIKGRGMRRSGLRRTPACLVSGHRTRTQWRIHHRGEPGGRPGSPAAEEQPPRPRLPILRRREDSMAAATSFHGGGVTSCLAKRYVSKGCFFFF